MRLFDSQTGGRASVMAYTPAEVRKEVGRTKKLMIKSPQSFKFTPPTERDTPPEQPPALGPVGPVHNPPGGEWAVTWRPLDSDLPKGGAGFSTREAAERWARARGITEADHQLRVFKVPFVGVSNPLPADPVGAYMGAVDAGARAVAPAVGVTPPTSNPGVVKYYVEKFKMKMGRGVTQQTTESWVNGIGDATPGQKVEILRQIQNWQLGASRNPEGPSAKYDHHRQIPPPCFHYESFKTVPLRHTSYPRSGRYMVPGALAVTGRIRKPCAAKWAEHGKRVRFKSWAVQSILTPKGAGLRVTRGERALENPLQIYTVVGEKVRKFGKRFYAYTAWAKRKFGITENPAKAMVMKEKEEHPWMTTKQAEQVAADHEAAGVANPKKSKRPKKPLVKAPKRVAPAEKVEEVKPPETKEEDKKKKRSRVAEVDRYWNMDDVALGVRGV